MHEIISKYLFQNVFSLLLLSPGTNVFYSQTHPNAELPLYFGNQRVLGVVSLPEDKCLDVGPQKPALRRHTHL